MTATIFATGAVSSLVFLSLAYAGILFQQPTLSVTTVDVGGSHAGAVFGFMNTAGNAASALSAIVFGYLVAWSGGYKLPFVPMLVLLGAGVGLWLTIDSEQQILADPAPAEALPAADAIAPA